MLTTVLFDLDDTLHDDTLAFRSAAQDVSMEVCQGRSIVPNALAEAFVEALEGFWQRFDARTLKPGSNVRQMMWLEAFRRFGIADENLADRCARSFEERRKNYYSLFPGAADVLAQLQQQNFRLALLTNGLTATHREKIELLGLSKYFSRVFLSDEIGVSKPDPAAFMHACDQLGASPGETAMVGDRYDKDIVGALRAGMMAVWLNVRNEQLGRSDPRPHAVVSSIAEVPNALQALREAK